MIPKITRVFLDKQYFREYHFVGQYVAVVFAVHKTVHRTLDPYGAEVVTTHWQRMTRTGTPYIDILALRDYPDAPDPNNRTFRDEKSPAVGGLNPRVARELANGLRKAAVWLKAFERGEVQPLQLTVGRDGTPAYVSPYDDPEGDSDNDDVQYNESDELYDPSIHDAR